MQTKYSKEQFDGFTHRFIVVFNTNEINTSTLHIYSNSDSYDELEEYINDKKSQKVLSFKIINRTSKEQDELATQLVNDVLNNF